MFSRVLAKSSHLSYAQSGEDRIIWNTLTSMKEAQDVFYVDIGAHHPVKFSNTYLLYRLGAHGVTVEPNAEMAARHRRKRPRDILIEAAVTSDPVEKLRFFHFEPSTMSTADPQQAEQLQAAGKFRLVRTEELAAVTPDKIAERIGERTVDVLSVDIEGEQVSIIERLIGQGVRPTFICCETIEYDGSDHVRKNRELVAAIEALDYTIFADTLINTIFVRRGSLPFAMD